MSRMPRANLRMALLLTCARALFSQGTCTPNSYYTNQPTNTTPAHNLSFTMNVSWTVAYPDNYYDTGIPNMGNGQQEQSQSCNIIIGPVLSWSPAYQCWPVNNGANAYSTGSTGYWNQTIQDNAIATEPTTQCVSLAFGAVQIISSVTCQPVQGAFHTAYSTHDCAGGDGGDGCEDPDAGEDCGSCGTIACDGSCNDPCNTGGEGNGGNGGGTVCDSGQNDFGGWTCGGNFCDEQGCDSTGCDCINLADPIIIDLDGVQYNLTNLKNGVKFNFFNTGKLTPMDWTAQGWDGGFLALDRNGNGKIDDGAELFGNLTPQTPIKGKKPNGFLALAEFDRPQNGGNGDGQIDSKDAIFSKLVVWVDKNHDGVSDPGELLTLEQAGVESISLNYVATPWTDAYGNKFRYRSQMRRTQSKGVTWVYDVLLGSGGQSFVPTGTNNE